MQNNSGNSPGGRHNQMWANKRKAFDPHQRPKPYYICKKTYLINQVQAQNGCRGSLVLFYRIGDLPLSIIISAVSKMNAKLTFDCLGLSQDESNKYGLKIDEEVIVSEYYDSLSTAKHKLAELALQKLQESCFSIIRKVRPNELPKIKLQNQVNELPVELPQQSASVGGIGAQMMAKMGWSGGGLGVKGQGTTNLVEAHFQVFRRGLGNDSGADPNKILPQEIKKRLTEYVDSKDLNPIAFTPDFTTEERAIIHQVANRLNLRTKSYGKKNERFLVVETKLRPWDIVHILIDSNDENEQFKLIYPTKFPK